MHRIYAPYMTVYLVIFPAKHTVYIPCVYISGQPYALGMCTQAIRPSVSTSVLCVYVCVDVCVQVHVSVICCVCVYL